MFKFHPRGFSAFDFLVLASVFCTSRIALGFAGWLFCVDHHWDRCRAITCISVALAFCSQFGFDHCSVRPLYCFCAVLATLPTELLWFGKRPKSSDVRCTSKDETSQPSNQHGEGPKPGDLVEFHGLAQRKFNGMQGRLAYFSKPAGRWVVFTRMGEKKT